MAAMPITRVVLYKHGVGYFEREGTRVEGDGRSRWPSSRPR